MGFLEIYNEKVNDLLSDPKTRPVEGLKMKEDRDGQVRLGLTICMAIICSFIRYPPDLSLHIARLEQFEVSSSKSVSRVKNHCFNYCLKIVINNSSKFRKSDWCPDPTSVSGAILEQ